VAWEEGGPTACPECGQVPEDFIEIVERVVPARGGDPCD
jgi:hypothetical protein